VVAGEVRLGVIPTALPVAARLVDRFGRAHPEVRFTVLSLSSNAILGMLEDFQIDGGLTYVDNEPLPQMAVTPMYLERYRLVTARSGPLGERRTVTWAEIARLPLCLFTRDMQNRRIVEEMLARHAAGAAIDSMQTNSSLVMTQLVMAGHWSSVMPPALIGAMPLPEEVATIPIVEPDMTHEVGLVMLDREPVTPTARALVRVARDLAGVLAL
jgi:DNA-binding transcriptional LysR family regulator